MRGLADYGTGDPRAVVVTGPPERVAGRYAEWAEAGAGQVVAMPFGGDWFRQVELLGEVARLLG
ncbi:hypothetical protein B0I33_103132 [Prauserella shujinwangii]|uniref:Luciferase-like monooxygenase n=1 Tax=Prauserella shujinwangii TaxID=1453103 RepID=A0A2T0LYB2_9PSEU|nr:hypothetical protein B0I33_103132 [Prauserella shujinwangii]